MGDVAVLAWESLFSGNAQGAESLRQSWNTLLGSPAFLPFFA